MRTILPVRIQRVRHGPMASDDSFGNNGAFYLRRNGVVFFCIASDGGGWEHVSVRVLYPKPRVCTWEEMQWVKEQWWTDEETVVQYHPRKADYVNCHPDVLHLWRPTERILPTPPTEFVGPLVSSHPSAEG